jgi:DNA polymerase I
VVVDCEFSHHPTGLPDVVCLCAHNMTTGHSVALWQDQLGAAPPYDTGDEAVVVFYSGTEAELACHLALGWPLPQHNVDLMTEYRMLINGRGGSQGLSMLDACARMGVAPSVTLAEKERMRQRILRGGTFSAEERAEILGYCSGDVDDECRLLRVLGEGALSPHALWRGRFVKSIAMMWYRGVPIARKYVSLATDPSARLHLKERMVRDIETDFPIYDTRLVLKNELLSDWLSNHRIPIPRTPSGKVAVAQEVLGSLARNHPVLDPLVESLRTQAQLKDFSLPIFSDCRLRAWFAPFMTITSRAAPPTNGYIYNLPSWMRSTMEPPPGTALAYLDFSAMEFGLAASCSGDPSMTEFYRSGDPYLATAVAAGALPEGATKQSHKDDRDLFKTGVLACLYGIGIETLGHRLRRTTDFARRFLEMHHKLFARYWQWSDEVVAEAIRSGRYCSRHGWSYAVQQPINNRSLRNWVIQALGAEILRCACIFADELGIEMLATAHERSADPDAARPYRAGCGADVGMHAAGCTRPDRWVRAAGGRRDQAVR